MRKITYSILCLLAFLLAACKDEPLDYSDVIRFENPADESIPADNLSTLKVTVQIKADADPDKRDVVFTSDIGTFTNGTPTITIIADKDGRAIAYLKSAVAGLSTLSAQVKDFKVSKTVTFTSFGGISLENPAAENLAADNVSTLKIAAHISPETDPSKRAIVFSTDLGTFGNNTPTVSIVADNSGNAVAYLKGAAMGVASVRISNEGNIATKVVNFTAPAPDNVFTVQPITDNVASDNVSNVVITAMVNKSMPLAAQKITFETDQGSFSNGNKTIEVSADIDGKVVAYLKNDEPSAAHVGLSLAGINRKYTVNFIRALPDYIQLSSAATLASGPTSSLAVSITLKRNVGKPNADVALEYSATDSNGAVIGSFSNGTLSTAEGTASVNFNPGGSTYKGLVRITVWVKGLPSVKSTVEVMLI
ncbi:hypothetical protein [Pedobacter psychrodurus]|uniref:hypothetical protein n=1 Tax=Pedobacter psychrodurus TaxID=2530456 RepID=UPI002930623D|nr:hypothetical protein [Pedobacter psychrodurus]